jgi:hypothetical protein
MFGEGKLEETRQVMRSIVGAAFKASFVLTLLVVACFVGRMESASGGSWIAGGGGGG